jgi:hypothetical protein
MKRMRLELRLPMLAVREGRPPDSEISGVGTRKRVWCFKFQLRPRMYWHSENPAQLENLRGVSFARVRVLPGNIVTKPNQTSWISNGKPLIAVIVYALLIAALAAAAAVGRTFLDSARLQGVVHTLQSLSSEQKELAKFRDNGDLSPSFVSAETTMTVQAAEDLLQSLAKMDISAEDKNTHDSAVALAKRVVAKDK